ncbi:hypothetical protein AAY72_01310 [Alishewanella sp. WH16-1]|uniref:motility associated factor glycosyltransferase family protein n=1 Tax=Alishewanella sp. WH16-1 TaxID=1651088 RepID=UPI000728037C|nr:6-hydroxymethylpterin diphosphokinase MptE-like protein [Alishewanella sp. WH16-1]KRS22882.1 hypothetical protein AAY72_01310 [Alishewanella sp. WH16-1]
MLNLISEFVHDNPDLQSLAEQAAFLKLQKLFEKNLIFFQKSYPDIYQRINEHKVKHYSVFCSKNMELNIVEVETARVLYSENPASELLEETADFCRSAPVVRLVNTESSKKIVALPEKSVVLIFGVGLGLHISNLLKLQPPRVLVIYEPVIDLFISSLYCIDWSVIFGQATVFNTMISLQVGNSGSTIISDLNELTQYVSGIKEVYLFRHLAHPVSDEVFNYLVENSSDIKALLNSQPQFLGYSEDALFVAERSMGMLANRVYEQAPKNEVFQKNLNALQQYYPSIYEVFRDYKPRSWRCVVKDEELNLFCNKRSSFFYQNVLADSEKMVERFKQNPLENKVILNQGGIEKFRSYIHYQTVEKLQPFLKNLPTRNFSEISRIEYLIVLGIGLGRHIELLKSKIDVKNLFLFEPNLDFFYASLFATKWYELFEQAEKNDSKIYFNIGGNGEEYFNDVMSQYYQTGAYGIANSLIFPSFLTPEMRKSLTKLYSQLQQILALGESFDHVRYGIAHTCESLRLGHQFIRKNCNSAGLRQLQNIPVFIVGNGPSLDESHHYIKEHRNNVIVISCGTALRSLYKLGITPDFHAEIEQNRATFGWISQVNDKAWLKTIRFLSVNGAHPDTASLFKSVHLAFKAGESSTNFFKNYLEKKNIEIISLRYSYPTVSNLAFDLFTELGFNKIYLFGVDLGYLDPKNHHSKHSAYFREDGQAVAKADIGFDNGLRIPGNFRPEVFTKPEFDFSRSILQAVIKNKKNKNIEFYNCSDGALIEGASSLLASNILVSKPEFEVKTLLNSIFDSNELNSALSSHYEFFKTCIANTDVSHLFKDLADSLHEVNSVEDAENLIKKQWDMLLHNYRKGEELFFYLASGSTLYMLSVLTRFIPRGQLEHTDVYGEFNSIVNIWKDYLNKASDAFQKAPLSSCKVDVSHMFNS